MNSASFKKYTTDLQRYYIKIHIGIFNAFFNIRVKMGRTIELHLIKWNETCYWLSREVQQSKLREEISWGVELNYTWKEQSISSQKTQSTFVNV